MPLPLWRTQCSKFLCSGHRHYALATISRRAYAHALFAGVSPDNCQQSEKIAAPPSLKKGRLERQAKKESAGLKERISSRRNLLEHTKVQEYLDFVASTNNTVTLADIERCRPPVHGAPGTHEYETDYNSLLDTLVRSFSAKQLRQFLHLYQLDPPRKRNKWHYAASIIERQWGWPSLTEIQKQQRDWTEVSYKSFPLDPRQAFLILGKDGADLLSLSLRHNVHVSFSAGPLSLKAEGLRGSLDNLSRYIDEFKDNITQESFELPFGRTSKPDLLERISRLTGVFIEEGGSKTIRMSYKADDVGAANLARRLTTRAAFELAFEVPTLLYSPTRILGRAASLKTLFPHQYFLYPFLTARSLPWLGHGRNLFRLRRVGEWIPVDARDHREEEASADRDAVIVNFAGEEHNIRDILLKEHSEQIKVDGTKRVITASFGHLLIPSPTSKRVTITSPLKSHADISSVLEWVNGNAVKPEFVSSLPVSLLNTPPAEQQFLHRLVYSALPAAESGTETYRTPATLKFEIVLGSFDTKANSVGDETHEAEISLQNRPTDKTVDLSPTCWVGPEAHLNLMIPDRSMDIHFTHINHFALPQDKWPHDLQTYFCDLQAFLSGAEDKSQPEAPLILENQGLTYVLQSSSTIRQSSELVPTGGSESDVNTHFPTISESSLDLESNQRSAVCQVTCEDVLSDVAWRSFLSNCEQLTALHHTSRSEV